MLASTWRSWLTLVFTMIVSVIGSLLVVWALSTAVGFRFAPATVAVISAALVAARFVEGRARLSRHRPS